MEAGACTDASDSDDARMCERACCCVRMWGDEGDDDAKEDVDEDGESGSGRVMVRVRFVWVGVWCGAQTPTKQASKLRLNA